MDYCTYGVNLYLKHTVSTRYEYGSEMKNMPLRVDIDERIYDGYLYATTDLRSKLLESSAKQRDASFCV
jgi:hypothetical protein